MLEPQEVQKANKEKLIEEWEVADRIKKEMEEYLSVLRDELFIKVSGNGEVIKGYGVTKAERYSFKGMTIEQAEEFGAVKKSIDESVLKKLHFKGVELPIKPTITKYIIIRPIEKNI